jgi:hypothetical protein
LQIKQLEFIVNINVDLHVLFLNFFNLKNYIYFKLMSFVIFTNKLPKESKYFQFIIDNYNKMSTNKLIYTKEYFEIYLSKEITSFYELIFIEHILTGEVLASIIVTKDILRSQPKSNCFNYFYTNFACVRKDYRNKNISKLLMQDVLSRFQTEYNMLYGITFETKINNSMNILKSFKLLNINCNENYNNKEHNILNELQSVDLNEFYLKKMSLGTCITNFPSCSKLYRYFQFEDQYIILYKIDYMFNNEIVCMYYLTDSTMNLSETIIIDLLDKLYDKNQNSILNIPEYLLQLPLKDIKVYNEQEIKVCNYISNTCLVKEFDISNIKIF